MLELDQAVDSVTQVSDGRGVLVTINLSNRSPLATPVDLRLTLASGETQDLAFPVEVWCNGPSYACSMALPAELIRLEIDFPACFRCGFLGSATSTTSPRLRVPRRRRMLMHTR